MHESVVYKSYCRTSNTTVRYNLLYRTWYTNEVRIYLCVRIKRVSCFLSDPPRGRNRQPIRVSCGFPIYVRRRDVFSDVAMYNAGSRGHTGLT